MKSKRILGKGLKLNEKLTTHLNPLLNDITLHYIFTTVRVVVVLCKKNNLQKNLKQCVPFLRGTLDRSVIFDVLEAPASTLTSAGSTGKNKAANYPPILLSVKIAEWENQTNLKIMRKMFSILANVAQGVKTVTAVKK